MITVETITEHLRTEPFFWVSAFVTLLGLTAVLFGSVKLFEKLKNEAIFFVVVIFFPIFFLAVFYAIRLDARYLSFAAPFYFILLAGGLSASKSFPRVLFLTAYASVNLWGSAQAIALSTDSIHKEDYLTMTKYVLEHAHFEDAVCGASPQFDYYSQRTGLKFSGRYFPNVEALAESRTVNYRNIWVMDGLNMHPGVSKKFFGRVYDVMTSLGYRLREDAMRFGGREGQTVLYAFEQSEGRHA